MQTVLRNWPEGVLLYRLQQRIVRNAATLNSYQLQIALRHFLAVLRLAASALVVCAYGGFYPVASAGNSEKKDPEKPQGDRGCRAAWSFEH